eukprot:scaffold32272_cov137-Skeletonema_menzelii.AAC.1
MALPPSAPSSFLEAVLLTALFGSAIATNTQYVCNNNEFCKLSSNGGYCRPTALGLPSGYVFSTSLSGAGTFSEIYHECIAFPKTDLVTGGGSCIMTCPATCEVTQNVANPCQGHSGSSKQQRKCSSSGGGTTEGSGAFDSFGNTIGGSTTGTTDEENNSGGTIVSGSGGTDPFGITEFVCKSDSKCTISSTGGICSPRFQGLPAGDTVNYSLSGAGSSSTVSYGCIGISNSDLVSGGGNCQAR